MRLIDFMLDPARFRKPRLSVPRTYPSTDASRAAAAEAQRLYEKRMEMLAGHSKPKRKGRTMGTHSWPPPPKGAQRLYRVVNRDDRFYGWFTQPTAASVHCKRLNEDVHWDAEFLAEARAGRPFRVQRADAFWEDVR